MGRLPLAGRINIAEVKTLVCDICGTSRKVELVCVTAGDSEPVSADLCPRHRLRLQRFIRRGLTPPGPGPNYYGSDAKEEARP